VGDREIDKRTNRASKGIGREQFRNIKAARLSIIPPIVFRVTYCIP
jgi:hypothetical protein